MFAVGTKRLLTAAAEARLDEEERRCLMYLRSCFTAPSVERYILDALPEVDEMPPPLLPPGWEQRLDEKGETIFFADHARCTTTWDDPRLEAAGRARRSLTDEMDEEDGDGGIGAADDLATLSVGVAAASSSGDALLQWSRTVELTAHAALAKAVGAQLSLTDEAQFPRYMLLQRLHQAVVRRLLSPSVNPMTDEALWERRDAVLSSRVDPLPRELVLLLEKHSKAGLTKSYHKRPFSGSKLNLRKVRKTLLLALPPPDGVEVAVPPPLPDELASQLQGLLLEPPPATAEGLELWALAAESTMCLAMISGSALTLLQLPRAVYCRGVQVAGGVPLAVVTHQLLRRCSPRDRPGLRLAAWPGAEFLVRDAGARWWPSPPPEGELIAPEDAALAVLVTISTLSSVVWERLALREEMPLADAGSAQRVRLSGVAHVVHSIIEMSLSASRSSGGLTPQQSTESWQPLAVELRLGSIRTLVELLRALLSGNRGRRELVSALCAMRSLAVYFLIAERCRVETAVMLAAPRISAGGEPSAGTAADALRSPLLERLFSLLLVPLPQVGEQLRDLWECMQAETICLLIAGLDPLFPGVHAKFALLLACVRKGEALAQAGQMSLALQQFTAALARRLAADKGASTLLVPDAEAPSAELLHEPLPRTLGASPLPFAQVQVELRKWLVEDAMQEAQEAVRGGVALAAAPSALPPCSVPLRLLAVALQETLARASLCKESREPPNVALMETAELLLKSAARLLGALPQPTSRFEVQALQVRLVATFIGALLPWLVDSLALFSIFAFEYAYRLLPLLLPPLSAIRRLLAVEVAGVTSLASVSETARSAADAFVTSEVIETAHPYNRSRVVGKSRSTRFDRGRLEGRAHTTVSDMRCWRGVTQLQVKFDPKCCTQEGDWLTLSFSLRGEKVRGHSVRLGGPWQQWPKAPLLVGADTVHIEFSFAPTATRELWGYAFTVTTSKREKLRNFSTPPLLQLQRSLVYLGAKAAALLVAAEPVLDDEKEYRHWVQSPLFVRGLPLQLPEHHGLMHPFFGIKSSTANEHPSTSSTDSSGACSSTAGAGGSGSATDAASFLDDLLNGDGNAFALHEYLTATTPELRHAVPFGEARHSSTPMANAERALIGALLAHNGLLAEAKRAAWLVPVASELPPPSPPPSPPPVRASDPSYAIAGEEPTAEEIAEIEELVSSMDEGSSSRRSATGSSSRRSGNDAVVHPSIGSAANGVAAAGACGARDGVEASSAAGCAAGAGASAAHAASEGRKPFGRIEAAEGAAQDTHLPPSSLATTGASGEPRSAAESVEADGAASSSSVAFELSSAGSRSSASRGLSVDAVPTPEPSIVTASASSASSVDPAASASTSSDAPAAAPAPIAAPRAPPAFAASSAAAYAAPPLRASMDEKPGAQTEPSPAKLNGRAHASSEKWPRPTGKEPMRTRPAAADGDVDWERLRRQWCAARTLFKQVAEAHARTLSAEEAAAQPGVGLFNLMHFLLLVAKQDTRDAMAHEHADLEELSSSLGSEVRRLFRNLRHDAATGETLGATIRNWPTGGSAVGFGAGAMPPFAGGAFERHLEAEVLNWVASRVSPEQVRAAMQQQQRRAYSRAAGFRAMCELLRVCERTPPLQRKLLSTLVSILRPEKEEAGLATHYSRDVACAGPVALGRVRLAFTALLEQLVKLLVPSQPNAGPADAAPALGETGSWPTSEQLLALDCILRIELRVEDLPVLHAVRLLPALHTMVRRAHGGGSVADDLAQHIASAVATQQPLGRPQNARWLSPELCGCEAKGMPRTLQLIHHALVSRFFVVAGVPIGSAGVPHALLYRGLTRRAGSSSAIAPHAGGARRQRGSGSSPSGDGASTAASGGGGGGGGNARSAGVDGTHTDKKIEEEVLTLLTLDIKAAAQQLELELSDEHATPVGPDTASDTFSSIERFLHASLALFFQLLEGRRDLAHSLVARDEWLGTLFAALHVGSLRCARLVLRMLRSTLPHRPRHHVPPALYAVAADNGIRAGNGAQGPPFASFLLRIAGDQLAAVAPRELAVLPYSRVLWRNAQVNSAIAAEAVSLARHLLHCDGWAPIVQSEVSAALDAVPAVLRLLSDDPSGAALVERGLLADALKAVGAFCVLGGGLPTLFVGCRVSVAPADSTAAERSAAERTVLGTLTKWDGAEDSEASVLLDSQLAELRSIDVLAARLEPLDDLQLPPSSFRLTPELMPAFVLFLPKRVEPSGGGEASAPSLPLQGSFLFGVLQTRALKAMRELLQHPASMRCALDSGMLPSFMASAATPVPLVGTHTTETLQTRVALLEHMHLEAAAAARKAKQHATHRAQQSRRQTGGVFDSPSVVSCASFSSRSEAASHSGGGGSGSSGSAMQAQLEALSRMGFEITMCQKAVGMFGLDTAAAVAWLTDDQAQQEQIRQLHRSPSWQLAEELAHAMGAFSVRACKKALERNGNNANSAAVWLLDHGESVETEVEAEVEAEAERDHVSSDLSVPTASVESDGSDGEINPELLRTVSFKPEAASSFHLPAPQPRERGPTTSTESNRIDSFRDETDTELLGPHVSLPDPLPNELIPRLDSLPTMQTRRSVAHSSAAVSEAPMRALQPEECLIGRLIRPFPLEANRNCVLHAIEASDSDAPLLRLYSRVPETDSLLPIERAMATCRRAEASLTSHFPELHHLGANSAGLSAVSGAAHMMLAILLARQAILCLLSDFGGLQSSHEDADSAFDLQQLGRPREVVDLLKLAFHSSEGGGAIGASAFDKLWGVMRGLTRGGGDGAPLPTPFKALPVLLRDDALAHLRRELHGIVQWQSPHPLTGGRLPTKHKLHVAGALQLRVQLDRRSDLGGKSALLLTRDEEAAVELGRWSGTPTEAAEWPTLLVPGDTVWLHLQGDFVATKAARKHWGFRMQAVADGWMPPAGEAQALDTPLTLGWPLLHLLSEHRPVELLTRQTYLTLARYVHTPSAPQLVSAASLLVRLLKLPAAELPDASADPRDAWPLERMLGLADVVDGHKRQHARLHGELMPLHIQLFAELVAQAHLRRARPPPAPHASLWVAPMVELCSAVRFLLRNPPGPGEHIDIVSELPERWLANFELMRLDVLLLQEAWTLQMYASLVRHAVKHLAGVKEDGLLSASPLSLPSPPEQGGILAGQSAAAVQVHFALLQELNRALAAHVDIAFSGCPELKHSLGAELCQLRELVLPEVKQAIWSAALDAVSPVRTSEEVKANPPQTVTINRHRAAKDRVDRRAKEKNSIFFQLHEQLRPMSVNDLKRRERAFKVKFAGEAADDHGGPYREVFTAMCSELENEQVLPLLLRTPNGEHNLGANRDKFVLEPAANSVEVLQLYEFLGMCIAFALMQKETALALNLCSVFWKYLVQQPADAQDLAAFDEMVCQSLNKIVHIEEEGVDEALFSEIIFETFSCQLSNGIEVEVCEGGYNIDVTWSNRARYCKLVMQTRLGESVDQTQAVLRGINTILPVRLLSLFTHRELELMTCGTPDIDITELRRHTRYGVSLNPDDRHILILWIVLESFTPEERALFLQFIWGRNRLPSSEADWAEQSMKLHTLECSSPDKHLPVTHTCFFSMEWPKYSSEEVAKERLLYAITNCVDMDADVTAEGRANMALSVVEEE